MVAQSQPIPLILTRPADQAARFAEKLRTTMGVSIRVIESPLLAPTYLRPTLDYRSWAAVIFTSATAVSAAVSLWPDILPLPDRAYCVGDRTTDVAREAGFMAISAKGDADALCALILAENPTAPLLHLRGHDAAGSLAGRLTLAGIETHEAVIYAEARQTLSAEAKAALQGTAPVILPVFSPRTAVILAGELAANPATAPLIAVAISANAANALDRRAFKRVLIARSPDAPCMLEAIQEALIAAQAA